MIISHEHRFIFVKTAKTAGTSIEVLLSGLCGNDAVVTPFYTPEPGHRPRNHRGWFNPVPELAIKARAGMAPNAYRRTWHLFRTRQRYFHHMPAWQIRLRNPEEWRRYHTFCVERDPYEKTLSGWHWLRSSRGIDMGLDTYIDRLRRHVQGNLPGIGMWPYNFPNYSDPHSGAVIVDAVLDYGTLHKSLPRVLGELGVDVGALQLPHAKKRDPQGAADRLTSEQAAVVAKLFRRELEVRDSGGLITD